MNVKSCKEMFKELTPRDSYFFSFSCSQIREGIIRCILATDMARHNEILTQFKEVTPIFDYSNRAHINLVSLKKTMLLVMIDISFLYL